MKRVTFLLGAGASIPAGYSSTQQITDSILTSEDYFRDTDGSYRFDEAAPGTDYETPVVRRIVNWLSNKICEYYLDRDETKDANYEEIYYLASQLRDDSTELQNPAILPVLRKLRCEMISWREYKDYCRPSQVNDSATYNCNFSHFREETCYYIEDIVAHKLSYTRQCSCKHLHLMKAIHQTDDIKLNGIATLAHDTHVERYLENSGVEIADGSSPPIEGDSLRIWRNEFFNSESVPFLKLHGSVNWKRFHLKEPANYKMLPEFEIGVFKGTHLNNSIYRLGEWREHSPLLLIGTFNKPAQYSWGLMLDIHYRFRKILANTQILIVCGYSFGDKAINTELIFWYQAHRNRSIIVIDPRAREQIIQSARFAVDEVLQCNGVDRFISKPMQDVEYDKLIQIMQ